MLFIYAGAVPMIPDTQPERVFLILESELEEWEAGGMCWSEEKDLHAAIRSRPHTPAPEHSLPVEVCTICDIAVSCDRTFGRLGNPPCAHEAARKATLEENKRVLDTLGKEVAKEMHIDHDVPFNPNDDFIPSIGIDVLAGIIESLREHP
jgi:hypothetical protein